MKKGLYAIGIILVVSTILIYADTAYSVIARPASLIAYLILGAIPFFINIQNINLVPLQIILFGISLMLGGIVVCSGTNCELEAFSIFLPVPFIGGTLLVWGIIALARYFINKKEITSSNNV